MVTSIYFAIQNWCAGRNMKSACIAVECSVVTCCRRLVSWPPPIQVSTFKLPSLQAVFICCSNATVAKFNHVVCRDLAVEYGVFRGERPLMAVLQ